MRIISGKYGGRKLDVPKGRDIRPTSDKVRGSIFNALISRTDIDGAQVMDLFCGTGALGLEALSRGAEQCLFVDKAKDSLNLARQNAHDLGADRQADFILSDATKLRPRGGGVRACDVFFCDPPYRLELIAPSLQALLDGDWLGDEAIGVLEAEKGWSIDIPPAFDILTEKTYGDTSIVYVRKT
jgi:16S rRNA (guanine966-N2)-methyltransferase